MDETTTTPNIVQVQVQVANKVAHNRHVRFNSKVKVKSTKHLKNYTNKQIKACWYSRDEYHNIKKALFLTVEVMTKTSSLSQSSFSSSALALYCFRGLEKVSVKGGLKYSTRMRRQNAIRSVLDEQYEQCKQYEEAVLQQQRTIMYDVNKIKNIYRYHTRISETNSYTMGVFDAKDADDGDDAEEEKEEEEEEVSLSDLLMDIDNSINHITIDDYYKDEDNNEKLMMKSFSSLETTAAVAALSFRQGGLRAQRRWSFGTTKVHSSRAA